MNKDDYTTLKNIILSNDQNAFRKALAEKNIHITAEQISSVFNNIVAHAKADNHEAIAQFIAVAMGTNQPINDAELEKINAAGQRFVYNPQTGRYELTGQRTNPYAGQTATQYRG